MFKTTNSMGLQTNSAADALLVSYEGYRPIDPQFRTSFCVRRKAWDYFIDSPMWLCPYMVVPANHPIIAIRKPPVFGAPDFWTNPCHQGQPVRRGTNSEGSKEGQLIPGPKVSSQFSEPLGCFHWH